jgi:branched-subunit amino acid aminotransferase/4-amino-4-deoxychorismate lyase
VVELAPTPGHPMGERAGRKLLPSTPLLRAREAARAKGAVEVLFHTAGGVLLEGSASNLFATVDGQLRTPPLTRGVLPGITRGAVIEAARAAGIDLAEADILRGDLDRAGEVFLTGSLMEVLPVRRVGALEIPLGPLAPRLLAAIRKG